MSLSNIRGRWEMGGGGVICSIDQTRWPENCGPDHLQSCAKQIGSQRHKQRDESNLLLLLSVWDNRLSMFGCEIYNDGNKIWFVRKRNKLNLWGRSFLQAEKLRARLEREQERKQKERKWKLDRQNCPSFCLWADWLALLHKIISEKIAVKTHERCLPAGRKRMLMRNNRRKWLTREKIWTDRKRQGRNTNSTIK